MIQCYSVYDMSLLHKAGKSWLFAYQIIVFNAVIHCQVCFITHDFNMSNIAGWQDESGEHVIAIILLVLACPCVCHWNIQFLLDDRCLLQKENKTHTSMRTFTVSKIENSKTKQKLIVLTALKKSDSIALDFSKVPASSS